MDNTLGQERIVVMGHFVPAVQVGIDPYAGASRQAQAAYFSGRGHEIVVGVFGVDTTFDSVSPQTDPPLVQLQWLSGGDRDLALDKVDAGDALGDGVLDLEAGIHFDEIVLVVFGQQKFYGAHPPVVHGPRRLDRRPPHLSA